MKSAEEWIKIIQFDLAGMPISEVRDFLRFVQRDAQAGAWEWLALSDDGFRLRMGECTAQEIRTCRAMLRAILATTLNEENQQSYNHV
jgi:hypothetical protein